ncbi:hypothetical protein VNO77_30434 [Canavalia gladiata]|uniref:Uncharacterized protein n=1 Tax=Canavalia gladiata TaxID=3824 RepID=A0AAN9KQ90_CANGL
MDERRTKVEPMVTLTRTMVRWEDVEGLYGRGIFELNLYLFLWNLLHVGRSKAHNRQFFFLCKVPTRCEVNYVHDLDQESKLDHESHGQITHLEFGSDLGNLILTETSAPGILVLQGYIGPVGNHLYLLSLTYLASMDSSSTSTSRVPTKLTHFKAQVMHPQFYEEFRLRESRVNTLHRASLLALNSSRKTPSRTVAIHSANQSMHSATLSTK